MAAFSMTRMDKDNPCIRECSLRSATCHTTCELYKAFRAKKDAEIDARSKEFKMDSYRTAGSIRQARKQQMDKKRGH